MHSTPDIIADALAIMFDEHFVHAPARLKDRFYGAVTPVVAGEALAHLARVRFAPPGFDFDRDGRWAVVAPIFAGERLACWGAFDVEDSAMRASLRPGSFAVGFDAALWDASHHPQHRMLMHHDVWSWLKADCEGCLPIDWKRTAIALLEWDVRALVYADEMQARRADLRIRRALSAPESFIKREKVAA
jgi:hypothetical protein